MANTGFQHFVQTPTDAQCANTLRTQSRWVAPSGGFNGNQVSGGRRVEVQKHGAQYRRQWRKLHIGIDAQTMQIRAICVTSKSVFAILFAPTIWCVKRQKYASDISREKFAEIEPELRKVRRRTNTNVIVFTGLQIQVCGLWAIYTKFCIPSATHHQIQSP